MNFCTFSKLIAVLSWWISAPGYIFRRILFQVDWIIHHWSLETHQKILNIYSHIYNNFHTHIYLNESEIAAVRDEY